MPYQVNMNKPQSLADQRIIVVPNEYPVPVNSGGRVDVWRRLNVLKESGAALGLLTWYDGPRDGPPEQVHRETVGKVCEEQHLACISRSLPELVQRLLHAGRLPSHVASRWVTLDRTDALAWARRFRPTLLLADGLYGAAVVRWMSAKLGAPWIYRSHNIEHLYMGMQLAQAKGLKSRLGLLANIWGLQQFERDTVADASVVLDISASDLHYWQDKGNRHMRWVPPIVDTGFTTALAAAAGGPQPHDALYFGNLNTPNNVEGVRWLVTQVLPRISDNALRLAVAGSKPSQEVVDLITTDKRLSLIANPVDMTAVVAQAKVLLNPVQGGSGVNLKSVEMLFSDAQLLSTSTGVQGLPPDVAACFHVADDPAEFAAKLDLLRKAGPLTAEVLARRQASREEFTPAALADRLADVVRSSQPKAQQPA